MTTTTECRVCRDTGRAVDHFTGTWGPCPQCEHRGPGLGAAIAASTSILAMFLVGVLVAVAWFGDLNSIPLIGK